MLVSALWTVSYIKSVHTCSLITSIRVTHKTFFLQNIALLKLDHDIRFLRQPQLQQLNMHAEIWLSLKF